MFITIFVKCSKAAFFNCIITTHCLGFVAAEMIRKKRMSLCVRIPDGLPRLRPTKMAIEMWPVVGFLLVLLTCTPAQSQTGELDTAVIR